MRHKPVRAAKLFCSLDRTPLVVVSATLFAVFLFALILTAGRPGFGRSDLPKVNNPVWEPGANEEAAIVLTVMRNGRVFWGQDPISVGDLPHKLRDRVERTPEATIYLALDAHAPYGSAPRYWVFCARLEQQGLSFWLTSERPGPQASIIRSPTFGILSKFGAPWTGWNEQI